MDRILNYMFKGFLLFAVVEEGKTAATKCGVVLCLREESRQSYCLLTQTCFTPCPTWFYDLLFSPFCFHLHSYFWNAVSISKKTAAISYFSLSVYLFLGSLSTLSLQQHVWWTLCFFLSSDLDKIVLGYRNPRLIKWQHHSAPYQSSAGLASLMPSPPVQVQPG